MGQKQSHTIRAALFFLGIVLLLNQSAPSARAARFPFGNQKVAEAELVQLKQAQLPRNKVERVTGQNGVGSENLAYSGACLSVPATRSPFLVKRGLKVKGPFPAVRALYSDLSLILGRVER